VTNSATITNRKRRERSWPHPEKNRRARRGRPIAAPAVTTAIAGSSVAQKATDSSPWWARATTASTSSAAVSVMMVAPTEVTTARLPTVPTRWKAG
jgi:hypothetical protein